MIMQRPFVHYAVRIKDGLFIGTKRSANEPLFQSSNQITIIINCAANEIQIDDPLIQSIDFYWKDEEDEQIVNIERMDCLYSLIESNNQKGESVLVCCLTGQSRSVTVVAAYLMKKFQWNLKTSLQYLQNCKKDFEIREGYLKQLVTYEKYLQKLFKIDQSTNFYTNEKILITNTFKNAQKNEIDIQENKKSRLNKKQIQVSVSWSNPLIMKSKQQILSYKKQATNTIEQIDNYLKQSIKTFEAEIFHNLQMTELIQDSKSYFVTNRKIQNQNNKYKEIRSNSVNIRLPQIKMLLSQDKSVSYSLKQNEQNFDTNKFINNRKSPTRGQIEILCKRGVYQFKLK